VFDYQPILRRWAVPNDPSRAIAKARRHRAPRGAGAQLRDTIVNAATELLIETGYAKAVSIRSVAQRAGVTSPSIYLHFADKDALLDAVCAQYFQKLDGQMQSAAAGCTTTVELLHALGMAYVRFALKTPVLYRIATMGEPRSPGDVDTVLANSAFVHLRALFPLHLKQVDKAHVWAKDSAHAALPALACGVLAGTVIALAIVR